MKAANKVICCLLALFLLLPGAEQARAKDVHCGVPLDWLKLANLARRTVRRLPRMSEDAPRDISAAMREINWGRLRTWQRQIDRPDIENLMKLSVEELRNFSSTTTMTRPRVLITRLSEIETRSASICVKVADVGADGDGGFAGTGASPAGFGTSPNGETFADYARLSMLPVIVATFGVLLKLCHMLMKWSHSIRFRRRSCRVIAELHIGTHVIAGTISVLGLHGCRFVVGDDETRALLTVMAGSPEIKLQIGSIGIASEVTALHDNWAAVRFKIELAEQLHTTILERSEVRPRYVTLPPLVHNVKKHPVARTRPGAHAPASATPDVPRTRPVPPDQSALRDRQTGAKAG